MGVVWIGDQVKDKGGRGLDWGPVWGSRACTWNLFCPANQNQQLPVQEVTQDQQDPQAAVIGRIVLIGS